MSTSATDQWSSLLDGNSDGNTGASFDDAAGHEQEDASLLATACQLTTMMMPDQLAHGDVADEQLRRPVEPIQRTSSADDTAAAVHDRRINGIDIIAWPTQCIKGGHKSWAMPLQNQQYIALKPD